MWDNYYEVNFRDHILSFNRLVLIGAKFEPDHGCYIDVFFADDYYICGESGQRVDITTVYRGLKGTRNFQVNLRIDGEVVKTFMVQTTPMGDILTPKE